MKLSTSFSQFRAWAELPILDFPFVFVLLTMDKPEGTQTYRSEIHMAILAGQE